MSTICRLLIIIFLAIIFPTPVAAQNTLKFSATRSIWVQEEDSKLTGPIVDFLTDFFASVGVEVVSEKMPWVRAIASMESGHLDLIPTIFRTREREKTMSFSIPYVEVPTVVFVARGKTFPFERLEDLIGRRGLVIKSNSISPEFNDLRPQLKLTEVVDHETMIRMLAADRADYAVSAKYGFLVESKRIGYEQKIETLALPIASRSLYIAISTKSPFLKYLPDINDRLQAMKDDGRMNELVNDALKRAAGR